MKRSKEDVRIEKEVDATFKRLGNCIQFDMFDLSKIINAGKAAGIAGLSIESAIADSIAKYRKN